MNARFNGGIAEPIPSAPIGKFSDFPGIQVLVYEGDSGDYLAMRAAQLCALMTLFSAEGFDKQSADTKDNARWLASSLASEINHLVPIALKDAAASA